MTTQTRPFDYDLIPEGFYHHVTQAGNPIRRAWHLQKFERVVDSLPQKNNLSILDVGCFAGTFLSSLPQARFSRQLGVDIVPKQIEFANRHFRTDFREFRYIPNMLSLHELDEQFDCITLIEVIEHLTDAEVGNMLGALVARLKVGGRLVLSTPNYSSTWPILEFLLNHVSDVTYEEQHLNKFKFFSVQTDLARLYPDLERKLRLRMKTTTHFVSPFLASISLGLASRVSRLFPHKRWHFPFGNLILMQFEKV